MRREIIEALKATAEGAIKKHRMNIEIYLSNPTGIGEHSDILGAIQNELDQISHYHDQLEVLKEYIDK